MAKTLSEIIQSVKSGEKPDYEDLRYAVIALEALWIFSDNALQKCAYESDNFFNNPEYQAKEAFKRGKAALNETPKDYVGCNNDPDNPEYQKRRKWALKLLENLENESSI